MKISAQMPCSVKLWQSQEWRVGVCLHLDVQCVQKGRWTLVCGCHRSDNSLRLLVQHRTVALSLILLPLGRDV